MMADYRKIHIPFETPGNRYERLRETVQIVKAFFMEETSVTFHGKHYTIDNLDASPKTTQKPHPPIMIGGRQKRMLGLAAREADIVSISDNGRIRRPPVPTFATRWVGQRCRRAFGAIGSRKLRGTRLPITSKPWKRRHRMQIPVEDVLKLPPTSSALTPSSSSSLRGEKRAM
jgi:hypothetical protein